jgi:hypothetical protein
VNLLPGQAFDLYAGGGHDHEHAHEEEDCDLAQARRPWAIGAAVEVAGQDAGEAGRKDGPAGESDDDEAAGGTGHEAGHGGAMDSTPGMRPRWMTPPRVARGWTPSAKSKKSVARFVPA